jgi:uncharacterized protein YoxC
MEINTLLGLAFMLICVLFIFLLIAISKINSISRKVIDVSPKDIFPFMEELRELVIESERVADRLGDEIRKKEELLEDLSALVDDKLKRLETIQDDVPAYTPPVTSYYRQEPPPAEPKMPEPMPKPKQMNMRSKIAELVQMGVSDSEIASKLGISITEVQIVKKIELG